MSNKFKVGDRVRFNWSATNPEPKGSFWAVTGKTGVITEAYHDGRYYPYTVQFDADVYHRPVGSIKESELTLEVPVYTVEDAREANRLANEAVAKAQAIIDELTESLKPALPTAFGSVVEVGGLKYLLDGSGYWSTENYSSASRKAMAEKDYTILREGI